MARLGATSADIEGAMTQLAQGASKGKFELEDLKSIAERIPGFFGKASAALGVTTAEFYEMVSAGQITADLLPQIARSLGATGGAVTSFNAQMSRLKNSFTDLFTAIGDTGVFDAIGWAIGRVTKYTRVFADSLNAINQLFAGTAESGRRAAEKLKESWKALFTLKDSTDAAAKSMSDVGAAGLQAGEDIAAGMGKAAGAMDDYKKLTEQLSKDLKLLGVDEQSIDQLTGQLEDQLVQGFQRIADNPAARGQKVFQAFLSAVNGVELRGNLERLKTALYDTFRDGKITADQMAASLNAINTKSAGMWKNLTDSALAEQKRLEAGLDASLKRREQVESDFARRREKINEPENNDEATFGKLFDLQSKARQLAVQAGQATGEEARRLSESALAMANKAADVVQQLNDSGKASDIEATGLLRGVETVAKQAADGLKNVPISIDTSKAQDQAREFLQVFQQYLEQNPVRVRVETSENTSASDIGRTLSISRLQRGS
jgi:tape measure domain-containing protein